MPAVIVQFHGPSISKLLHSRHFSNLKTYLHFGLSVTRQSIFNYLGFHSIKLCVHVFCAAFMDLNLISLHHRFRFPTFCRFSKCEIVRFNSPVLGFKSLIDLHQTIVNLWMHQKFWTTSPSLLEPYLFGLGVFVHNCLRLLRVALLPVPFQSLWTLHLLLMTQYQERLWQKLGYQKMALFAIQNNLKYWRPTDPTG